MPLVVSRTTGELGARAVAELYAAYDAIFGDQPDLATWRADVWDRHAARPGFRLARAREDGRLVGFAYGYTGEHGQWWTDRASQTLPSDVAAAWLGGHFELVSIGVLATARGARVGATLLSELTADLPHERWTLMTTADSEDPARRLYASHGWLVLGDGLQPEQVVMAHGTPRTPGPVQV